MRVATINLGSATLKIGLADVAGDRVEVRCRRTIPLEGGPGAEPSLEERVHSALQASEVDPEDVDAVGHRVVHGGTRFTDPVVVDAHVEETIHAMSPLAPLHNPAALAGLRAARTYFAARPMVAVFDTGFHADRPPESMVYPLPRRLAGARDLVRYGFHGIAHAALTEDLAEAEDVEPEEVNAVILQLGGGCSACAVRAGRSIETSMGATPLEGLPMPARSGDVGPGALLQVVREVGGADEAEDVLSGASGLRGLAGTADVRELLRREGENDERAALALSLFVRRIVMTTGAYLTLLDGDGAVVFGGGIGSNSSEVRRRVASGLSAWNVELDRELNSDGGHGLLTRPGSRPVYAFDTDEERLIARQTARTVDATAPVGP